MRWMLMVLFLSLQPGAAIAQQAASRPHKTPTPEQVAYREKYLAWSTEYRQRKAAARAILAGEEQLRKAGDCPQAVTTVDDEECLSKAAKEAATAEAAFVVALRGLLLDSPPEFPGAEAPPGPSGTPPTPQEQAAELDHLETLWAQWLPLAGTAEYHLWQGGTIAPVMSETTVLDLTRRHMEDLADIYDDKLADR